MAQQSLTEEQIRVRAYEIFLRRGGQGGTPEEDWLLAQQELLRETTPPVGAAPQGKTPADAASAAPKGKAKAGAPAPEGAVPPPKKSVRTVSSNTASRRSR